MLRKFLLLFLFISPLAAVETEETAPSATQQEQMLEPIDYKTQFQKLLISIFIIIILILIVVYCIKLFSSKQTLQLNKKNLIKVIECRSIGHNTTLFLVEVGGKKVLISESKLDVQRIASLDPIITDETN